jgi:hypothetical protein
MEAEPRRLTGRAHKQQREILTGIIEEHVAFLERSVPLGDIERAMHSVRRLGVLISEMKALEGWTWEYPRLTDPDRDLREKAAALIADLAAAGEELNLRAPKPARLGTVYTVPLPGEVNTYDAERVATLKASLEADPDLLRAVREVLHERTFGPLTTDAA